MQVCFAQYHNMHSTTLIEEKLNDSIALFKGVHLTLMVLIQPDHLKIMAPTMPGRQVTRVTIKAHSLVYCTPDRYLSLFPGWHVPVQCFLSLMDRTIVTSNSCRTIMCPTLHKFYTHVHMWKSIINICEWCLSNFKHCEGFTFCQQPT